MTTALTKSGLRLMIYDTTDVKRTFSLPSLGPDASNLDIDLGLSHSWFAGGLLYRGLRRLDLFKGFLSWNEALGWLSEVEPDRKIDQIQYWGHGSPGRVWMNGQALTHRAFGSGHAPQLSRLASRLTPESLVWFRTCATFTGDQGQDFAQVWSQALNCRVAAHTFNTGVWQSGLHSIRPGELPSWSAMEGIKEGTPDAIKKIAWSMPWSTNTITCLHGEVPKGW
jgi:hypothetical protein